MPFALIHGVSDKHEFPVPVRAEGVNTENSFYTDAPSITAVQGFLGMLSELEGMVFRKIPVKKGIKIDGFAFFIHGYERHQGMQGFSSGIINYVSTEDKLINAPVPLEVFMADMSFSIIIQYQGRLPNDLDEILNARTRRFNGGSIMNDIMITDIDDEKITEFFKRHKANQVIDRSELGLTSWESMLDYVAFFENPETKKRDLRKHSGVYYLHQTGYQLLEDPQIREGALLLNGHQPTPQNCKHAYCEPVINLAELRHTNQMGELKNLSLWRRVEDIQTRTVILQAQ